MSCLLSLYAKGPEAAQVTLPTWAVPREAGERAPGLLTVTVTFRVMVPPSPTESVAAISEMEP